MSEVSQPEFNPSKRLEPLYNQEDLHFLSQLGELNMLLISQIYDAYGEKGDDIVA